MVDPPAQDNGRRPSAFIDGTGLYLFLRRPGHFRASGGVE